MNIVLNKLIPIPLRDKIAMRQSAIWNQQVDLPAGEWLKIKAPSGTGKTTLVHIIWQLRSDFTGSVHINGLDTAAVSADQTALWRQQNLSVIFQDMRLFGNLTARENIELKRVMNGQKPYYQPEIIDEMAELLGISAILNQTAATCSYGEQQRVSIVRALMQPFNWLIMDEPFSHLDQANTAKAAALIARECKQRRAGFILTDLDDDHHFDYTLKLDL